MRKIKNIISGILYTLCIPFQAVPVIYSVYCSLFLIKAMIPAIVILTWKIIINHLTNIYFGNEKLVSIALPIFLYVGLNLLESLINTYSQWANILIINKTKLHIDQKIMKKYTELDIEIFDNPKKRDILDIVDNSEWAFTESVLMPVQVISLIISFVSVVAVLISFSPLLAVIYLLSNIPYKFVASVYKRKLEEWNIDSINTSRKKDYIKEILIGAQYAKDLRVYNLASYFKEIYLKLWNDISNQRKKYFSKDFKWSSIMSIISYIGYIFVILFAILKTMKGFMTIGDLAGYINATESTTIILDDLVNDLLDEINVFIPRINRFREFISWKSNIKSGTMICPSNMSVKFNHVSFHYPGDSKYVLKNLNMEINNNQKVAIVGLNGAGKSTIIKLLLHFYEPTSGVITINGVNIQEYSLESLRKNFSVCFQEVKKYSLSLEDNIQLYDYKGLQSNDRVEKSLREVDLWNDIQEWKCGLKTPLTKSFSENGKELSGGQWQKLSIARSIYRNSSFVILDEPSSALDPESEKQILELFYKILTNKSGIIITHKLSGAILANKIIFIENGRVMEEGTHNELNELGGKYAEIYKLQADKYKEVV